MLFCLVVVGDFAVFAVDSSFCADLKVLRQITIRNLLPTLTSNFPVRATFQMLQRIIIRLNRASIFLCRKRTAKFLCLKLLFGEPVNRKKFSLCASNWALVNVFSRFLSNPLLDALTAESGLTFLAFYGLKDDFETDLADEEGVELIVVGHDSLSWTQIFLVVYEILV